MKYLTVDNHNFIPYFVVFRKPVLDKLTPDQQKTLSAAVREVSDWVEQQQSKEDAEGVTLLRNKGMQVIELAPAEVKVWQEAARPVRDDWIKRVGKDGEDLLQAVEQDVRR
jgi:TRAP-type C4-dicarboxylate transport system substrate-binding protein